MHNAILSGRIYRDSTAIDVGIVLAMIFHCDRKRYVSISTVFHNVFFNKMGRKCEYSRQE